MLQGLNDGALAELEELRTGNGGLLSPEDVLARARSANSALHRYFEWDDGAAAQAYRLQQARQVIRAVVRLPPPNSRSPQAVRAYISLPSDRATGAGYRAIEDVADDAALAAEALRELQRVVARIRMRYGALAAVSQLVERIASMVEESEADVLPGPT